MKNWANKIKKSFSSRSPSTLSDACEFDLERLAKQLAVEGKAEQAAENNLPEQTATSPDGAEREIQSYFENKKIIRSYKRRVL